MKFPNEGRKILNYTNEYINNISVETNNFMNYCKSIYNDNISIKEGTIFLECYEHLHSVKEIFRAINDKVFKIAQKVSDNERPNVLYPYEKQAIYEYFKKPDLEHKCYKKFGCIYAEKLKVNNKEIVSIGISVCNDKDEFSKNVALNLARKRAREYFNKYDIRVTPETKGIPFTRIVHVPTKNMYEDKINMFIKRCKRWFKDETILYPTNIIFTEFPDKKKKKSDKITDKPMPF